MPDRKMMDPTFTGDAQGHVSWGTTALHVGLVLLVVATVIAISAHAPSTTIAYAQLQQIGAIIGTIETGEWLLPRDHTERVARKGLLYTWIAAPIVMLTQCYSDFVFRLPTVLASLITGVLVYLLGRRWYSPRAGLIAACLWATIHHMAKLMYVALTDMMVAMFITVSIFCADRLLFHRPRSSRRFGWILALWASVILGGLTKGRGLLNITLVGITLGLAGALWDGYAPVGEVSGPVMKLRSAARLTVRRWWEAIKATKFLVGMFVTVAVLIAVWAGMMIRGGEAFREVMDYEVWSRITGKGERTPHPKSVPTILNLLYYMLPVTVFAIGAMVLAGPRRWFSRQSPLLLPLCWIISVVLPFSLTYSARHDYLLPCYPAGALMGGWAIEEISRRIAVSRKDRLTSAVRHAIAATGIVICALLILAPLALLFNQYAPGIVRKNLRVPPIIEPETWWIFALLAPAGVIGLLVTIRWSLRWNLGRLTAVIVLGMLAVMFVERHAIARQSRTGDGEKLKRFASTVRRTIGDAPFAGFQIDKLGTELYVGRFAIRIEDPPVIPGRSQVIEYSDDGLDPAHRRARSALRRLRESQASWLITCEKGLVSLGAAQEDQRGRYVLRISGKKVAFVTDPHLFGTLICASEPVISQRWGKALLIKIDPSKLQSSIERKIFMHAKTPGWESGRQEGY